MERRRDWIITVRLGCLVILLTSSFQRNCPCSGPQRFSDGTSGGRNPRGTGWL